MGREQRRERERRELGQPGERRERPPRRRRAGEVDRREDHHRDERVVGIALQGEQREGKGDPRVGQRDAERRPAHAAADQEQQQDREQVEHDRGGVRGRQVVPGAAPAEDLLERDVGLVVDRAVRVAVFVVGRPVSVEGLAVDDLLAPITPGVADVDHVRVGHVQRDPKAEQRDDAERQHGRRNQQAQRALRPAAAADPESVRRRSSASIRASR